MSTRCSSTADTDHSFLLHISFHYSLLVFSSMWLTQLSPSLLLTRIVYSPAASKIQQSLGSLTLIGLLISFEGFVPSAPYDALPHPYITQFQGFYMFCSAILRVSFCCIFWLTIPSTSSMYFLSISNNTFPVTFSALKILTKSSKPSACANLTTSSVVHWLDSSCTLSQAKKCIFPPLIFMIFFPKNSGWSDADPVLRLSSQSASLQMKQATDLEIRKLSLTVREMSCMGSCASLNL